MSRWVTITAQETLAVIRNHRAFVKNIASDSPKKESQLGWDSFDHHWAFLIKQLVDPQNFRPAKRVPKNARRNTVFDVKSGRWIRFEYRKTGQKSPTENQWGTRLINPQKGMPKPGATHAKKTSVSLFPPHGMMHLFPQKNGIVLILNSALCKVKERYVFEWNMITNDKPWYRGAPTHFSRSNKEEIQAAHTTLGEIRAKQLEAGQDALRWNECQVDPCAEAVIGLGVPQNNLTRRLNAQYRRLLLLKHLGRDVPLFILSPNHPILEYAVSSQQEDLLHPTTEIDCDFVAAISKLTYELYFQDIHNSALAETQNIFRLIQGNHASEIAALLAVFPGNIFLKNKDGKTPLQFAFEKQHFDCVLAIASVSTNKEDTANYAKALRDAALLNKTEVAIQLIKAEAPLNYGLNCYYCPRTIHLAIYNRNYDLLSALLKKGGQSVANIVKGEGLDNVPLLHALRKKDSKAVQLLIEYGAVLDQSTVEALANVSSWNDLFDYCRAIFYDTEKVSQVVGWVYPIAYKSAGSDYAREQLTKLSGQLSSIQGEKNARDKVAAEVSVEQDFLLQKLNEQRDVVRNKDLLEKRDSIARNDISQEADDALTELVLLERMSKREITDLVALNEAMREVKTVFVQGSGAVLRGFLDKIKLQITVLDAEMLAAKKPINLGFFAIKSSLSSAVKGKKEQKRSVLVKTAELLERLLLSYDESVLPGLQRVVLENAKWDAGVGKSRTGMLVREAEKLMRQYAALSAAGDLSVPQQEMPVIGARFSVG